MSVEAVCEDNTYLVFASIDQSEEWPHAYVISITPSSFAGSTSGEQDVTVVIGWHTGETQTFHKTVRLDGECAEHEEEEPPTDVCPNVEGDQESIPEGMIKDGHGNCVVVEHPKGCPDGLPANAGKDGEAGNDDCERTPPVVTPPVVTPPVVNPPVVTPPTAQPPKPTPPAVCVQLGISTHVVRADGKRDRLVVKVGNLEGAKVSIRGAGVSQSARTNAQGIACSRSTRSVSASSRSRLRGRATTLESGSWPWKPPRNRSPANADKEKRSLTGPLLSPTTIPSWSDVLRCLRASPTTSSVSCDSGNGSANATRWIPRRLRATSIALPTSPSIASISNSAGVGTENADRSSPDHRAKPSR